jgi:hypothetical protein
MQLLSMASPPVLHDNFVPIRGGERVGTSGMARSGSNFGRPRRHQSQNQSPLTMRLTMLGRMDTGDQALAVHQFVIDHRDSNQYQHIYYTTEYRSTFGYSNIVIVWNEYSL